MQFLFVCQYHVLWKYHRAVINMSRKSKRYLWIVSIAVMLLLTIIFPNHRNVPYEDRYLYGFPDTFITIYSREFYLNMGLENLPPLHRRFLFYVLQFFVNILIVYVCIRVPIFIFSVCKRIYIKLKAARTKDAPE